MGRAAGWGAPRRRLIPGWLALVGAAAALVALIYFPWEQDQQFADVTFRTWTCTEAPVSNTAAAWTQLQSQGACRQSVEGLQLELFQANSPNQPDRTSRRSVVFERVSTASVDFSLQLRLQDPAREVLLHPASHGDDAEEMLSAFHGDAAGVRWTSYWRPSGRSDYDLVVVPRDAG